MKLLDKNISGVIFDMDGVLIDSYLLHKRALELTAKEYGFSVSEEEFISIFGKTSYEGMKSLPYCNDWSFEKITEFNDKQDAKFRELFKESPQYVLGAIDFARKALFSGLSLAIGTSAPKENAQVFLDSINFVGLFSSVVTGDDVKKGKPDPEIYLKCSEQLGISPADCLVFEDSLMGIESAKAAGMTVIALSTTHKKEELKSADFVVRNFMDYDLDNLVKFY